MLKKSRAYKKERPFKDARLFIIVAEGEREDKYFTFFNEINPRIKVQIVPRDEGKSAPNFFLERVTAIQKSGEWTPEANDELWFICDVDRWERKQIDELNHHCEMEVQWNLAISNPCFEVWLHFHSDPLVDNGESCKELKTTLPNKVLGEFNVKTYCPALETAHQNALNADEHQEHYFPERMNSKLHRLADSMLKILGKDWK